MSDPARLLAAVRTALADTPYGVEPTDDGFVLTAEVTGPPRARGRRERERLTHAVVLDAAAGTYRVRDTRESLGEATDQGASLLRLDRRATLPLDPAVEAHRLLAETAAAQGWAPARATVRPGLVVGVIAGVFLLILLVALLLVF